MKTFREFTTENSSLVEYGGIKSKMASKGPSEPDLKELSSAVSKMFSEKVSFNSLDKKTDYRKNEYYSAKTPVSIPPPFSAVMKSLSIIVELNRSTEPGYEWIGTVSLDWNFKDGGHNGHRLRDIVYTKPGSPKFTVYKQR